MKPAVVQFPNLLSVWIDPELDRALTLAARRATSRSEIARAPCAHGITLLLLRHWDSSPLLLVAGDDRCSGPCKCRRKAGHPVQAGPERQPSGKA
jgi:hypothetical protein